jgi:hypothetical protein
MSITHSDDAYMEYLSKPALPRYQGKLKELDPSTITPDDIHNIMLILLDRYDQVAAMRRDLTNLAEKVADLNDIAYFTNKEQTWFLGPKSPSTQRSLTGGTWILDIALNNPNLLPRIRQAVEDMSTLGHRIHRKRAANKKGSKK